LPSIVRPWIRCGLAFPSSHNKRPPPRGLTHKLSGLSNTLPPGDSNSRRSFSSPG
jgi:hypothetical protein